MARTLHSKAAVVTTAGSPIETWDYEIPLPAPGCVNIAVLRAGVCGTDLHLWKGDSLFGEPFILGHEGVGRILELGDGVTTDHSSEPIAVGDIVYWNPIRPCNACYDCTIQRDLTGCTRGTFFSPAKNNTTWASYAQVATLQPNNSFYRIDSDVPVDAFIALGCALPTMLKGLENLGPIQTNSAVLVQGCGAVGLAAIMLAKLAGARVIVCIDANPVRLEMARRFGVTEAINLKEDIYKTREQRAVRIREVLGPRGADVAIECSGNAAAIEEGLSLLARNGRYLLVGTWAGAGTVQFSPFEVVHKAIKIIGTTYASPENYYGAARIVEANYKMFPLAACVTHRFPVTEAKEALEAVAGGTAIKVVIEPQN